MQVIKNFIKNKNIFNNIKSTLMGENFPWFFSDSVGHQQDKKDFYFRHSFYESNKQMSNYCNQIVSPILGRLKYNYLLRARANLYTKHHKNEEGEFHIDSNEPHTVALFYVNSCNGYTKFQDGTKIMSEENKMIIFNGNMFHSSVTQTDTKQRIIININIE